MRRSSGSSSASAKGPDGTWATSDCAAVSADVAAAAAPAAIEWPHSMQNLASGGLSAPHDAHFGSSAAPHDMQKRALSGFSVEQLGQTPPAISRRYAGRGGPIA